MLTDPLSSRRNSTSSVAVEEAEDDGTSRTGLVDVERGERRTGDRQHDELVILRDGGGCCGTENLRALWGLLILNTSFAIAQMIGAEIANSLSMFSDSGSMLVDSFAYIINLFMERKKNKFGPEASKLWEASTSMLSVFLLIIVTLVMVLDAAKRLATRTVDEEGVDGRFVLGFSLGNLAIDICMCANYCYQTRSRRRQSANIKDQVMRETKEQLNMVAAYVHLFADTLRTLTGLVAGILEQQPGADAVFIDAVATFVVCFAILLAAGFVFYEAILQFREYRSLRSSDTHSRVGLDGQYAMQPGSPSGQSTSGGVEMRSASAARVI